MRQMELDYYKGVLKCEITDRFHSRMPFEETELWYLLYNLLEAAYLMEPLRRKIGDLHPKNIVVNEKGRIKVVPSALFPASPDNYQQIVADRVSDVFLAPEELDEAMIDRGAYPAVNPCRAEVFNIGVTMLMAATLRDSYYLYDRKKMRYNGPKEAEFMEEVRNQYSPYFGDVLNALSPAFTAGSSNFRKDRISSSCLLSSLKKSLAALRFLGLGSKRALSTSPK